MSDLWRNDDRIYRLAEPSRQRREWVASLHGRSHRLRNPVVPLRATKLPGVRTVRPTTVKTETFPKERVVVMREVNLTQKGTRERSRSRRFIGMSVAFLIGVASMAATASPADAVWLNNQRCVTTSSAGIGYFGYECTGANQSGNRIGTIVASRGLGYSCNYQAWFYYVPPSGGVVSLGNRSGGPCTIRQELGVVVNRNFTKGTRICSKFYWDNWSRFSGESCIYV